MKVFRVAMVIAAVIICGGIAFNIGIGVISSEMETECKKITEAVEEGRLYDANEHAKALESYIKNKKTVMASVIEHKTIDDLELCVSELLGYTKGGMSADSLVYCYRLSHIIRRLPANYRISPQNIL